MISRLPLLAAGLLLLLLGPVQAQGVQAQGVQARTLLLPGPVQAQGVQARTWALVVGIDDYIHLDGVSGGDLLGAEHDARAFFDYLTRGLGVPGEQVMLLTGSDATAAGIRRAVKGWLGERAGPGDRVYFFYSGHGSQVLDEDGDEEDGLDETLSPADALPLSSENDLVDDEINAMLGDLLAAEIIVILDSCSSGTATKVPGVDTRPRRLQRPLERPKGLGVDSRGSGFVDGSPGRIVELAASAPHQTALDAAFLDEHGNVAHYGGAFTTHLLAELWAAEDATTLRSALLRARAVMRERDFLQEPQFSGSETVPVRIRR
jgi:hypothetical protein